MSNENTIPVRRNRLILVLLVVVAAAPLAYSWYLKWSGWQPEQTVNFGELIRPARPLPDATLDVTGAGTKSLGEFRGKWLMLTFAIGHCDEACAGNLYKMRQTHVAQGKYQERIRRLLVVIEPDARHRPDTLRADDAELSIGQMPRNAMAALAKELATGDGTPLDGLNRIYLVDPIGNFMMTYRVDADPTGIRKDLARLMRASQIG
jgi:cytochrome oxidase Cu insertion factor (SCO1/SenC/PrrC family)